MIDAAFRDRVIDALWPADSAQDATVWAILDCARDDHIHGLLRTSRLDYRCLYSGRLPRALETAAPHLIELPVAHSFTRRLVEMAWGKSWGIFVRIKDSSNLRYHLRTLLRVHDESGSRLLFRYYDPRVLRIYLPTCTRDELKAVFGPIDSYVAESEDGQNVLDFAFDGTELQERRMGLTNGLS